LKDQFLKARGHDVVSVFQSYQNFSFEFRLWYPGMPGVGLQLVLDQVLWRAELELDVH